MFKDIIARIELIVSSVYSETKEESKTFLCSAKFRSRVSAELQSCQSPKKVNMGRRDGI